MQRRCSRLAAGIQCSNAGISAYLPCMEEVKFVLRLRQNKVTCLMRDRKGGFHGCLFNAKVRKKKARGRARSRQEHELMP
jgi:hypothetical protein